TQPHLDTVPVGQAAHHEQTHAAGDRNVDHRRLGELLVGALQLLGRHTDTRVGDLDDDVAVVDSLRGHRHLGVVRGEHGGVLHQLGDEVDDVVDWAAQHRHVGGGAHVDPRVLLRLGDRGPQHVDQRNRLGPLAGVVLPGEDQQVLVVAAHAGGQVVELE